MVLIFWGSNSCEPVTVYELTWPWPNSFAGLSPEPGLLPKCHVILLTPKLHFKKWYLSSPIK